MTRPTEFVYLGLESNSYMGDIVSILPVVVYSSQSVFAKTYLCLDESNTMSNYFRIGNI